MKPQDIINALDRGEISFREITTALRLWAADQPGNAWLKVSCTLATAEGEYLDEVVS